MSTEMEWEFICDELDLVQGEVRRVHNESKSIIQMTSSSEIMERLNYGPINEMNFNMMNALETFDSILMEIYSISRAKAISLANKMIYTGSLSGAKIPKRRSSKKNTELETEVLELLKASGRRAW